MAAKNEFVVTKDQLNFLTDNGYLILPGVLSSAECDSHCASLVSSLSALCPSLKVDTKTGKILEDSWKPAHLPPSPRSGLFQGLVSTFPSVLELRSHPRVCDIFRTVYSHLRKKKFGNADFFSSMDGINVRPLMKTYHTEKSKDWAHLDQTIRDDRERCVQGQIVLSDTTACFRASPKSHLVHDDILDACGVAENDKGNWLKMTDEQVNKAKELVEKAGGEWQVPIRAPRGSVILWFSSLVHSAMTQLQEPLPKPIKSDESVWRDWRFVVYVCHRPKSEVKNRKLHAKRLKQCLDDCRVTNHWGEKMFPKKRFREYVEREQTIAELVEHPEKVRKVVTVPDGLERKMNPLLRE